MSPYTVLRSRLLAVTLAASCTGSTPKDAGTTGDTGPSAAGGTACLAVVPDATECPPASGVAPASLVGGCGSTITSVDGEATFGSDPTGWGDTSSLWCCYPVHQTAATCDYGRPYVVEGRARLAEAAGGAGWCGDPGTPGVRSEQARVLLAAAWIDAALDEHAAVAAFARVTLDLLTHGAPADLVAATLAAGVDEVRHAELGFALASAYAGRPVGPGEFPTGGSVPVARDLAEITVAAVREGCVGETLTTLLAVESLARATDPAVRRVLEVIVADEQRHAELAWRTVAWALAAGGERVREAVADAFRDAVESGVPVPVRHAAGEHRAELVAHGIPDAATCRRTLDRGLVEVVRPAAEALLARFARTTSGSASPLATS